MDQGTITLNRWLVGTTAAACFIGAVVVSATAPDEAFWWGGLLRAGVVLTALWFCLPTRTRPAAWANFKPLPAAIFAGTLLIAIVRPKIGIPILVVLLALRYVFTRTRRPVSGRADERAERRRAAR